MTLSEVIIKEKAARIKWFFSDVDGSLTDGCTYYSSRGEEMKKFSHSDGTGFFLLRLAGIKTGLITGENIEIVSRRAEKLKTDRCFLGVTDKLAVLEELAVEERISLDEIAYLGDDLNDYLLFARLGLTFAPSDARPEIRAKADFICMNTGGHGAFREAAETLLRYREVDIIKLIHSAIAPPGR